MTGFTILKLQYLPSILPGVMQVKNSGILRKYVLKRIPPTAGRGVGLTLFIRLVFTVSFSVAIIGNYTKLLKAIITVHFVRVSFLRIVRKHIIEEETQIITLL